MHLSSLIDHARVLVCVGSGGVGKTTTAAALGLWAARRGRRTLIITIDPARRLADALGLQGLAHEPRALPQHSNAWVMMLDPQTAWDDMLNRTAPDRAQAETIRNNRFYAALARDLPGAHEFIATEQLHFLHQSGRFDLIVLDTPPMQHAIDFLEAPKRILGVLDNQAFRLFAARRQATGVGFFDGALAGAGTRVHSVLARFTGAQLLDELGGFVALLRDLYAPLTVRLKELTALFQSEATRFVLVAAPQPSCIAEARVLASELRARELRLAAVVANRMAPCPSPGLRAAVGTSLEQWLNDGDPSARDHVPEVAAALDALVHQEALLAQSEEATLGKLLSSGPFVLDSAAAPAVVRVPRLPHAVHDHQLLDALVSHLIAGDSGAQAQVTVPVQIQF